MNEEWKDIKDFEGLYKINSFGRVKSCSRRIIRRDGSFTDIHEKYLKPGNNGTGYLFVYLWKDNKQKRYYVHRLVAEHFIPNPNNLPQINHKDENKENNIVTNLEWCSNIYNQLYNDKAKKAQSSRSIPITQIFDNGKRIVYKNAHDAEKYTNSFRANIIKAIKSNMTRKSSNCYWRYANQDEIIRLNTSKQDYLVIDI
jgi:hypothetical protein